MASRASRKKGLQLKRKKLGDTRAELVRGGAPKFDVDRIDRDIDGVDRGLTDLRLERSAKAAALVKARRDARRKGAPIDKFALVVARSKHLTNWHFRVGEALRGLDEVSMPGSGGGLSGQAGDGDGNIIHDRGYHGADERGEAHYGTLATPGVVAGDDLAGWQGGRATVDAKGRKLAAPRTFKPKAVKRAKRASDGGMAVMADAGQRRDRIWAEFMDVAEKAGLDACGRVGCSIAAQEVIRGDSGISEAFTRYVRCRRIDGLDGIQIAMAAGLDAVAHRLGFGR